MASINKVMLIGNVGRDPEVRYLPSGDPIASLSLATSETWKDKAGEKQERTEWHTLVFFGRQAEIAGEYLRKGSQIYVEGSIATRKWQDKDGNDRYSTEIKVDKMQMLNGRQAGSDSPRQQQPAPQPQQQARKPAPKQQSSGFDEFDSDIPF